MFASEAIVNTSLQLNFRWLLYLCALKMKKGWSKKEPALIEVLLILAMRRYI